MKRYAWMLSVMLLVYVGCAHPSKHVHHKVPGPSDIIQVKCCKNRSPMMVQYLGVGGVLMRSSHRVAVLTAPFYTNPSLLHTAAGKFVAKTERLEKNLPPVHDVLGLLVGHSHYDHLLEVPYIANNRIHQKTRVFLNQTGKHTIALTLPPQRMVAVNRFAATETQAGVWLGLPSGKPWSPQSKELLKILAIRSNHAPHFSALGRKIKLYNGTYRKDLKTIPQQAEQWREGQTHAFLMDWMDPKQPNKVDFRVYYNDASSDAKHPEGNGHVPDAVLRTKSVDLALLCAASHNLVDGYPEHILKHIQPKYIALIHWESFFQDPNKPLRIVPGYPPTRLNPLVKRVQRWIRSSSPQTQLLLPFPVPGQKLRFLGTTAQ
ncbi:MAG: hypothetical protein EP343_34060 [Deltaproteobacteria bacterium]|nr:MAG: hypothetical protein EP343_34060 [Deltaproteobacteria bacterium]